MVSDQFDSLTAFDLDQYKTLCDFFHDLTLSVRLPLGKEVLTDAEVGESFCHCNPALIFNRLFRFSA